MRPRLPALALSLLLGAALGCSRTVLVLGEMEEEEAPAEGPDPAECTTDVWSRAMAAFDGPSPTGIAVDAGCSAVLIGSFRDTVDFGGGPLTSSGGTDVFVVKLGPEGEVRWSKNLGDGGDQQGARVAIAPDGTVVVASHEGTGDPGSSWTSAQVIWLSPEGEELGAQPLGSVNAPVRITGMAVDPGGAVVLTGYYQGSVDFGGGPMLSAGLDDIFVARYEAGGAFVFARRFGDTDHQSGAGGVAVDKDGDIYLTGGYRGAVDFGGGPFVNEGDEDVYLVKLGPLGETLWAQSFGDLSHQQAGPIAVSDEGRVAIAGTFEGEVDFGGGVLQSTAGFHFNLFVAQFDAEGGHRYSLRFGDVNAEDATGIGYAPEGHLVLAGHFAGSMVIGDQGFSTNGGWDIFAVRFDGAGNPVASRQFGDQFSQRCDGVAVDPLGKVLLTGSFEGSIDLGDGGGPLVSTPGDADAFVARLSL